MPSGTGKLTPRQTLGSAVSGDNTLRSVNDTAPSKTRFIARKFPGNREDDVAESVNAITGDGSVRAINDIVNPGERFYRVRIQ